jgi:hypothetical protein
LAIVNDVPCTLRNHFCGLTYSMQSVKEIQSIPKEAAGTAAKVRVHLAGLFKQSAAMVPENPHRQIPLSRSNAGVVQKGLQTAIRWAQDMLFG